MRRKVSVIGSGAVGATLAQRVAESGLADVVLVDILGKVACGKAYDMLDASAVIPHECDILGTDDYSKIASSDIIVVTAGLARKPGMTREDLVVKNAEIVKAVCAHIKTYSPNAIVIMVTNPLDVMTYLANKITGIDRKRVFGMAGVLDASRLVYLIAKEANVPRSSVETFVMGSHGDTMVPIISKTKIAGKPISGILSKDKIEAIVKRTCDRGAEIVSLLGTGSAYYSPSAAVFKMIKAIFEDSKEMLVASSVLCGEYGLSGVAIGVPCILGKNGIEKVVEMDISENEMDSFQKSAKAIRSSIDIL